MIIKFRRVAKTLSSSLSFYVFKENCQTNVITCAVVITARYYKSRLLFMIKFIDINYNSLRHVCVMTYFILCLSFTVKVSKAFGLDIFLFYLIKNNMISTKFIVCNFYLVFRNITITIRKLKIAKICRLS